MSYLLRRWIRNSRCYSTSIPSLPPACQWDATFKGVDFKIRNQRSCLSNPETAALLVKSLFEKSDSENGNIVIEAFPGPGVLTRALLQLPRKQLSKLIVLEDVPLYFNRVKELEKYDDRIVAFQSHPCNWDTYVPLKNDKLLGEVQDWNLNSNLHYICHLPQSVLGEQFFNQIVRSPPDREWLFHYGRMHMHFLMTGNLYHKIVAKPGSMKFNKLSVMVQAIADFTQPLDSELTNPYPDHFWPLPLDRGSSTRHKLGHPIVAASLKPKIHQIIKPDMLEKWDYVLRNLFILKTTTLRDALPHLAAGAKTLTSFLEAPNVPPEDAVDLDTKIKELTLDDWCKIVKAFDQWPFAPVDLQISLKRNERQ